MAKGIKEVEATIDSFDIIQFSADVIVNEHGSKAIPWRAFISENEGNIHLSLYLYNELFHCSHYAKLFALLRRLHYYNTVDIHINCTGGDVSTLMGFANALYDCQAYITVYLDGFVESAAAIIAFMGDKLVVHEYSSIMFHSIQFSGYVSEDGSKLKMNMDVLSKVYENMLKNFCSEVLTKEQIRSIIDTGAEIRFTGPELLEIMKKANEADDEPECVTMNNRLLRENVQKPKKKSKKN